MEKLSKKEIKNQSKDKGMFIPQDIPKSFLAHTKGKSYSSFFVHHSLVLQMLKSKYVDVPLTEIWNAIAASKNAELKKVISKIPYCHSSVESWARSMFNTHTAGVFEKMVDDVEKLYNNVHWYRKRGEGGILGPQIGIVDTLKKEYCSELSRFPFRIKDFWSFEEAKVQIGSNLDKLVKNQPSFNGKLAEFPKPIGYIQAKVKFMFYCAALWEAEDDDEELAEVDGVDEAKEINIQVAEKTYILPIYARKSLFPNPETEGVMFKCIEGIDKFVNENNLYSQEILNLLTQAEKIKKTFKFDFLTQSLKKESKKKSMLEAMEAKALERKKRKEKEREVLIKKGQDNARRMDVDGGGNGF